MYILYYCMYFPYVHTVSTSVVIDHTIPFQKWGTTEIEVAPLLDSISLDINDILDHGLMGWLEDAATGTFKISVDVMDDLEFQASVAGIPVPSALANVVLGVIGRITIPIDLPDDFKEKCADAVGAYSYLTGQKLSIVVNETNAELDVCLTGEGNETAAAVGPGGEGRGGIKCYPRLTIKI